MGFSLSHVELYVSEGRADMLYYCCRSGPKPHSCKAQNRASHKPMKRTFARFPGVTHYSEMNNYDC